jgi:hypothetical protein
MTAAVYFRTIPSRLPLLRPLIALAPVRLSPAKRRCISTSARAAQRRSSHFSSGYTNEYSIPPFGNGRGPIFDRKELKPLYPRDIKERVDAYVVAQDKAKVGLVLAPPDVLGLDTDIHAMLESHQHRPLQPPQALHTGRATRRTTANSRGTAYAPLASGARRTMAAPNSGGSLDSWYYILPAVI